MFTELNLMKTYILGSAVFHRRRTSSKFWRCFRQCRCYKLTGTDTTAHWE